MNNRYIFVLFTIVLHVMARGEITILPYNNSRSALQFISNYIPKDPIILEAGAFDGTNTLEMALFWKNARIHAFEPVPEIYNKLFTATKNKENIKTYNLALSNKNGYAEFFLSEMSKNPGVKSGSGSLLQPTGHLKVDFEVIFPQKTTVKTITLDDWAQETSLERIDFMWLDMQGYELPMLMASPKLLSKVKIIYTEANFIEGYKGQPVYKDYVEWFKKNGFSLIARDTRENKFVCNERWYCNAIFINNNYFNKK